MRACRAELRRDPAGLPPTRSASTRVLARSISSATSASAVCTVAIASRAAPARRSPTSATPGTDAASNQDTREVNTRKVSARSQIAIRCGQLPLGSMVTGRSDSGEWDDGRNPSRPGQAGPQDESHSGAGVPARVLRTRLHQPARTDRGHHPFGAEHRQAGQPDHPRAVPALPHRRWTTPAPTASNSKNSSAPPASTATRPRR